MKNIKLEYREYKFYTDGSLVREEEKCRIGASWVQVNEDESKVIIEEKIRLEKWPLLTKAELAAVLIAVLVVACNSRVVIKLDSAVAIASLEREKPLCNIRA